ncbi:MAG: hypothetical protein ACRDZY_19465, partial [Acidimicrobiales bacterium]
SSNANNLAAISAASERDVWAVGDYYTQSGDNQVFRNLALHWDGSRWTATAVPNASDLENTLFSVAALPNGRAWAVGYYADASFTIRSLAEYYDGAAWHVVPTPNPGGRRTILFSVAAASPNDVWAVGGQETGASGRYHSLVEHWDGQRWSVVPSADPGPRGNELYGVTAKPGAVWAVGQSQGDAFPSTALVERLAGDRFAAAPAPSSAQTVDPYAATTVGDTLIGAGDRETDQGPQTPFGFAVDGRRAVARPGVTVATGANDFYGVTTAGGPAGGTAWAAGRSTDLVSDAQTTLVETLGRDGRWRVVPTTNPGGAHGSNGFGGITATPTGTLWAAGSWTDGTVSNRTLIERYVP